jgi:hypothetical protein
MSGYAAPRMLIFIASPQFVCVKGRHESLYADGLRSLP